MKLVEKIPRSTPCRFLWVTLFQDGLACNGTDQLHLFAPSLSWLIKATTARKRPRDMQASRKHMILIRLFPTCLNLTPLMGAASLRPPTAISEPDRNSAFPFVAIPYHQFATPCKDEGHIEE